MADVIHPHIATCLWCLWCDTFWVSLPTGGLEAQQGMAAISSALRNYRPAQTVLQASSC